MTEQYLYVGVKSGYIHRSFIKINNLPTIDSTTPILHADFTFAHVSNTTTGKTIQLERALTSWDPTTITYSNKPTCSLIATCDFNATTLLSSFNITTNIAEIYNGSKLNLGYSLRYIDESTTNNPDYNVFYSGDYSNISKRPILTITYGYTLPSCFTNNTIYTIQNVNSSKFLNVHYGYDVNNTNVYQWTEDHSVEQNFKLIYNSESGYCTFKAMCSSNGNDKVLDIVKLNGYVSNGCNVQLYSNIDPIAQQWLIIPVSSYQFKIIPRTNLTLALSSYGTSNGTANGTTSTSAGNVFVSTYTGANNQLWIFRENGNIISCMGSQSLSNGTYYINNYEYGKFLKCDNDYSISYSTYSVSSRIK